MNPSSYPHPGCRPAVLALFTLAAVAIPSALDAALTTIKLGEVESTWQFETNLNETNAGTPLTPVIVTPAYSAVTIGGKSGTALNLPALPSTQWIAMPNAVGGNGGSLLGLTNEWTIAMDLKLSSFANDAALLQTDATNSNDAEAHVMGGSGVQYEYYETGDLSALPDFDLLTPVATGTVADFDLSPRQQNDRFAFRFRGRIRIATPGDYTFYTTSDDGSQLHINGSLVVDNDGLHGAQTASGSLTLTEGTHDIEVTYFEVTGSEELTVEYEGPGISRQVIPASVLSQGDAGVIRLGPVKISDPATIELDKWHRVVITSEVSGANLACKVYVDGVQTEVGGTPFTLTRAFDGDYALPAVVKMFTDDNGESLPLLVNSLSYWGGPLSSTQVAALGAPIAAGCPDLYITNSDNDGPGSLRKGTEDVRDGGLVFFELGLSGTLITLGSGGPITITGRALEVEARHLAVKPTINGADSFRIFDVEVGSNVSIRGLDLTKAFSPIGGGALRNESILEVVACTVRESQASNGAGIINESTGTLSVIDSTIANNNAGAGGGVTNAGSATFTRCTIQGNTAGGSGGIENINTATLINCTVTGNSTDDGGGGGLSSLGSLTLISCTVTNNTASDPASFPEGGGGVLLDFTANLTIDNTIVAGNVSNVTFENNIGGFGSVTPVGANMTTGDPDLEILGDYGGPTQTMPPKPGSPAAGTGFPTVNTPATDQRGFARIDGNLDLGAAETSHTAVATPFDSWAAANIPGGQDRSFNGDPEGDGIENGLEYGFRMDPQVNDPLLVPLGYPVPPTGLTRDLEISIPYRDTGTDLIYILLESADMETFTEIWRYEVATATETITDPTLQTTIDTGNQVITILDAYLNPYTTFWKTAVQRVP